MPFLVSPMACSPTAARRLSIGRASADLPARLRSRLVAELEEEALRFEMLRATFAALTRDSANTTDRDRALAALRMFRARAVIEEIEGAIVRIDSHEQQLTGSATPARKSSSRQAADAPPAVRRVLALAQSLLDADRHGSLHQSRAQLSLPRVALLRDELHVTANRVARFGVEEHPIVDPSRVAAPTAASAVIAPGRLSFQLDLAADRLIALLEPLTPRDWSRSGRMGDRIVTVGELVDGVLDQAVHDLLELLHPVTGHASHETDGPVGGRSRRDEQTARISPDREASRHAAKR